MTAYANNAVFISYASQDAEAAKKICDALRAAGVEVWFDQSELVGGDAWDQKIRKQIKDCALFVPIISANTNARLEGYFRREWRMAVDRMHDMDDNMPFLVPVVIDDTSDVAARVPERFRERQWTRLPSGETPPPFCERVKKLLGPGLPVEVGLNRDGTEATSHQESRPRGGGTARTKRWLFAGILSVGTIAALAIWQSWRTSAPLPKAVEVASTISDQAAAGPSSQPPKLSDARKLVAKAWEQLNTTALGRAELEMADRLCRQAAELDPNDPDVWAAWSQVDTWCYYSNLERTPVRREGASSKAARALKIAPDSYEARLAQACFLVREEPHSKSIFADEAERHLRRLLEERPDEPRVLFALGVLLRNGLRYDEGAQVFDLLARQPAFAATALSEKGYLRQFQGHLQEAGECAEQSIAIEPFFGNLALKAAVAILWYGDLDQARLAVEAMPAVALLEDFGAGAAFSVYWRRREPEKMLRILRALPQEWLSSNNFSGPKQYYVGMAHEMAGRMDAARAEWRIALEQLNVRLQSEPSVFVWHLLKARLLVWLGSKSEAAEHFQLAHDFAQGDGQKSTVDLSRKILLGDFDGVIKLLQQATNDGWNWATAAALRTNPTYDPIRADPRFQALLSRVEADPRLSPNARPSAPANRTQVDAKSVAVLAFANLSDDKGNEYFSDGISEELLNVLAKVPGLTVKGRSSGFFFKGKDTPVPEIAQQLGVTYIVQGSVRKAGNRVRISAQLIRAAADEVVWSSGSLDRELQDIFAVQDEIAGLVAQQLQLKLGVTKPAGVVDPEAHRLLLEARHYWHQRGEENFDRTEALLRRALAIDSDFAPAHAAMADLWVMRAAYRTTEGVADLLEELRSLRTSAARATQLDPSLVAPIAAMAYGLLIEGRMEAAQQQFEAAVAQSPNDPTVRLWRALFLMQNGDFDAARREFAQARELDPKAWIITHLSGQNALQLGRTGEALALFRQANDDRPDGFAPAVGYESLAWWRSGRSDEAVAAARAVRQSWPKQPRWQADAHAIWVLRKAGLTTEAEAYADVLFAGLPAQTYQRGFVLAALGRFDEALPYLERTTTLALDTIASLVIFDPWREDPRFTALIEKLHWTAQYAKAREAMKQAAVTAEP